MANKEHQLFKWLISNLPIYAACVTVLERGQMSLLVLALSLKIGLR
jgi:hypothetical protein